ncbi:uncharacterized protein LTR77_010714 [Saxophila tyrrhenica]|uniref:Uncharacterized protein n=1 Tax=Saxophila tyrrhenica TaxID=1690608 RepID=A0AAV9NUN7_9PEZI|nr:hypothetical protein LTR77_010714 [Saxophila tyrrhenica]
MQMHGGSERFPTAMSTPDTRRVENLLRELDAQRTAYIDTFTKVHEQITQTLASTVSKDVLRSGTPPASQQPESRSQRSQRFSESRAGSDKHVTSRRSPAGLSPLPASSTGFESDSDDGGDEALYVQTPLEPQSFDLESLRAHLRSHQWDKQTHRILDGVVGNPSRLSETPLIPNRRGKLEDRSDHTHYQVFDVGPDGSVLPVDFSHIEKDFGRAMAFWHAIKEINPETKQRHAVGRITIVREPSPILFGAIHYTMNKHFDMNELLGHLFADENSSAKLFRSFEDDARRQRSFVFNFEYFTLIGKDCEPMKWQLAAGQEDRKPWHISITRCSSVVALVLNGPKIKEVKNPRRRKAKDKGPVYDPFSSWQVLNIQCYPDLQASLDVHDSTKHYVNGPEAFMTTILGEFRDAYRRFSEITKRISKRVRPPLEFMFDSVIRDKLLFEDDEYTMARRYFWAHTTLGIMNESIKALVDAYEERFTDEVWEGKHKTLWPLLDETSTRNKHYRKKMSLLRAEFDLILARLRRLVDENNDRRREIQDLREDLFTGTSIQESRKSVNATETTVQQGHNIKLLTMVSIFFLPLTFVTSVFGMTDIDDPDYRDFTIVTCTVCVPFFVLIGSLNSRRGLTWWKIKTQAFFAAMGVFFAWMTGREKPADPPELMAVKSFDSQSRADTIRLRRFSSMQNRNERGVVRGETMVEEPSSRGEGDRRVEDGLALAASVSPAVRPSFGMGRVGTSRIAEMWGDERERKRRLTYGEDV